MDRFIEATVATGPSVGDIVVITRMTITPSDIRGFPFRVKRRQFPVRVAFAMTINKAQGQTFQTAGVYLPKPVFSHGQIYVALSRVGDPGNLYVLVPGYRNTWRAVVTKNVVYRAATEK